MLLFVGINPFGFGAVSKLNRSINDAKRMIIFLTKTMNSTIGRYLHLHTDR